jgi:hypothetical protein
MTTLAIFVVGVLVTGMTVIAVFLIGLSEAGDPAHSRPGDLSGLERSLVNRSPKVDSEPPTDRH